MAPQEIQVHNIMKSQPELFCLSFKNSVYNKHESAHRFWLARLEANLRNHQSEYPTIDYTISMGSRHYFMAIFKSDKARTAFLLTWDDRRGRFPPSTI